MKLSELFIAGVASGIIIGCLSYTIKQPLAQQNLGNKALTLEAPIVAQRDTNAFKFAIAGLTAVDHGGDYRTNVFIWVNKEPIVIKSEPFGWKITFK